jgi:hypothetical protein
MNQNNQYVLPRLRTLVEDTCAKGSRMSLPRLVLDVVEPPFVAAFVLAFNEEFDATLTVGDLHDELTFRDLLEHIN